MPKASEIAIQLRKVADLLDRNPDNEMPQPALSWFAYSRDGFIASVAAVPRPIVKSVISGRVYVEHETKALRIYATALQSVTCVLVKPMQEAVYEFLPLLSAEDEASL